MLEFKKNNKSGIIISDFKETSCLEGLLGFVFYDANVFLLLSRFNNVGRHFQPAAPSSQRWEAAWVIVIVDDQEFYALV